MQLTNYVVESDQSPASGSKIISLYQGGGTTGSATGTFNGPTGTYNVVVGYFDETDGKSQLTVKVGGVTDTWTFDKWLTDSWVTSKTKATRTVAQGVTLQAGSTIQLSGVADGGEWARVDYIDFIRVEPAQARIAALTGTESPTSELPTSIEGTSAADTLIGNSLDNIIRGYGGDDLLTGGEGRDRFVLAAGEGTDTITDFVVGTDSLNLIGGLTLNQMAIVQGSGAQQNDTLVSHKDTGEVLAILRGVQANTVTSNSFSFG
ncbi:hypothetical protein IQ268_30260 [Oculatella sp. LEGE 06141]|nr:hypothetical protein [Oculatella sp. LEGE 06141]